VRDQVDGTTPGNVAQDCICTTATRAQGRHVEECPLFDAWYDSVKPRQRDPNPRCHSCSSPRPEWAPTDVPPGASLGTVRGQAARGGLLRLPRRRPAARLLAPANFTDWLLRCTLCARALAAVAPRLSSTFVPLCPASVLMLRMIAVGRRDVLDVIDMDQEAVTGS
jgi:hypothetical protein